MPQKQRIYIAIDLKSFYASVECADRGLDPLTTYLVVADESRTEKTICLAVSPSLKKYGIGGRARLFEVIQRMNQVNQERKRLHPNDTPGKSYNDNELKEHPGWAIDYLVAPPRMARYKDVSRLVNDVYLKYVSPEDLHVYSVDEVFMDISDYLFAYKKTPHELAMAIIQDVLKTTGITATAGIGSNLFLAKVAMDIVAKHIPADKDGVRIAELDEQSYREKLWNYKPLTKFWRVGHGIADKLAPYGIDTMGKIARMSIENEDFLYQLFGINAELLIDHAWGWEPCTIQQIQAYKPENRSFCSGQVLSYPYPWEKARVVVNEMADVAALELVEKELTTRQITLSINYDKENLRSASSHNRYKGAVSTDYYGRQVPKHAHGSVNLPMPTSSSQIITKAIMELFDRIVNPLLFVRRINISINQLESEHLSLQHSVPKQLDLFKDHKEEIQQEKEKQKKLEKERQLQEARIAIKKRYGKNAILKGLNFAEGATTIERNKQIGGHKA